eukprot:TRINITY_DN9033_c0_g1_i2.p2 TRINITY_DN9033_c0_g1~~TRINITY_DN9033_c0_g1_i2.p2  ORF type:complete len:238 (+),score=93.50 TRINITY_DN9033_c0_g1_i2:61-774(+)
METLAPPMANEDRGMRLGFESLMPPDVLLDDGLDDDEDMALELLGSALLEVVCEEPKSNSNSISNSESQGTRTESFERSSFERGSFADSCEPSKMEDEDRPHPWMQFGREFSGPPPEGMHGLLGPYGQFMGGMMGDMDAKMMFHGHGMHSGMFQYGAPYGQPGWGGYGGPPMQGGIDGDMHDMHDGDADGSMTKTKKRSRRRRANKRKNDDSFLRNAPSHDECVIVPVDWKDSKEAA